MTTYAVRIDGAAVPLSVVLAELTIRHGLDQVGDPPTAAVLSATLTGWAGPVLSCGQSVELDIDGAARFRGSITDLGVGFDTLDGRVRLQAAGNLASVARRKIGYGNWPQESWAARVARVFAEAGWTLYDIQAPAGGGFQIAARAAGETTVSAQLADLAATGGASITDQPNGRILVQSLEARQPAAGAPAPPTLDPELVRYAPEWVQTLDVANVIDVAYGPLEDQHTVTSRNQDSVNRYGERSASIASTFASSSDAAARGMQMVNRRGYPRWIVPSCDVLELADAPPIGVQVTLIELPDASPVGSTWRPVVEGFTDQLAGDAWQTTLILSDPARSGLTLRWSEVAPTLHWSGVKPTAQWTYAYSMEAIEP